MSSNKIGAKIRARRLAKGWSTVQLASAVGVSQGQISRIETGRSGASLRVLENIADALGVRLSALFDEDRKDRPVAALELFGRLPEGEQDNVLDFLFEKAKKYRSRMAGTGSTDSGRTAGI